MKLSEKRQQAIYDAIHEPVMKLRVRNWQGSVKPSEIDRALFDLVEDIWNAQRRVLGID